MKAWLAVALTCLLELGCTRSEPSDPRAQVRATILTGFMSALVSEGPIEKSPWLVSEELDTTFVDGSTAEATIARKFSSYDREAFADLMARLRQPGAIAVPHELNGRLQLVSDATADSAQDSIAMTGQLIVRMSPIGVNRGGTRAAAFYSVECGPGCAAQQVVFLSGNRNRWIPVGRARLDQ
jgi:hypothetical protein